MAAWPSRSSRRGRCGEKTAEGSIRLNRGAHAPSRAVSGALAGNPLRPPFKTAPESLRRRRQRQHGWARVLPESPRRLNDDNGNVPFMRRSARGGATIVWSGGFVCHLLMCPPEPVRLPPNMIVRPPDLTDRIHAPPPIARKLLFTVGAHVGLKDRSKIGRKGVDTLESERVAQCQIGGERIGSRQYCSPNGRFFQCADPRDRRSSCPT